MVQKWRAFELEIAELVREGGFHSVANARLARPRQTDLYARGHGMVLLIEVKNKTRKIDVADIDNLRARLNRTASDFVGVLFTTSGMTRAARDAIEADRRREIVVILGEEINWLRQNATTLIRLLERKREELRVNGRVWIGTTPPLTFAEVPLPAGNLKFCLNADRSSYFATAAGFAHTPYVLNIQNTGWGIAGGEGVRLRLRLELHTVADLRDLLGCLQHKFRLSHSGMFHIRQEAIHWYGAGAEDFVEAVKQWPNRYRRAAMKEAHHSEDITYYDQLRDGYVLLSSRQRISPWAKESSIRSFLYDTQLTIQRPTLPLDTAPYLDLARYTGNFWAGFEFVPEARTKTIRLKANIRLKPVGRVVETRDPRFPTDTYEETVVGLIALNPFYGAKRLANQLQGTDRSVLADVPATKLLLCSLRDHLDSDDVVDYFYLEGFETTEASTANLVRPFGTWNKLRTSAQKVP